MKPSASSFVRRGSRCAAALWPLAVLLAWLPPAWAQPAVPGEAGDSPARPPVQPTAGGAPHSARSGVHVVVYLVDTLRADRLTTYGYDRKTTSPQLDQLAEDGVLFERCYTPAPWTMPSIASLFTARYPVEHKMLSTYDRLPASVETLAERLKRLGYSTFTMYGTGFLSPEFGLHQGFDQMVRRPVFNGGHISRMLGTEPSLPVFLYVHTVEPHNPYRYAPLNTPGFERVSPDKRRKMHQDMLFYKRAGESDYRARRPLGANDLTDRQDEGLRRLRAMIDEWNEVYDASVYFADSNMGSTIDMLRQRGYWNDTLFIFTADHGEEFDDHGGWLHDQSVYSELMHVPLVIRFPRNEYAGRRVGEVVSLIDVMATIFDYLGRPELAMDGRGRSLIPSIRGDPRRSEADAFRVPGMRINTTRYYRPWAQRRGNLNVLIFRDHWQGIWNADPNTMELYDLRADPDEQLDVQSGHPELVEAMRRYAAAWYASISTGKSEPEESGILSEDTLDALRALGYVDDPNGAAAPPTAGDD